MARRTSLTVVAVLACVATAVGCTRPEATAPTTIPPTTIPPTTIPPTTIPPTTVASSTAAPTTVAPLTVASTTAAPTTAPVPTTTASSSTSPSTSSSTVPPPVTVSPATSVPAPGSSGSVRDLRPAADIPAPPIPAGWTVESIGTSVQQRDITAWSRRVDRPSRTVVVVGAVHGNEPASPPTVRALVDVAYPDDMEVWLVPMLNPDGVAAGTRWNANGVDLNRNFPWGWRPDDGGPGPLSEPEARAAVGLIERVHPDVVVWVHQPYGYVTSVGASDDSFERAWSAGSGLPVRPDVTQHGGGESWSHFDAGLDSMLVEIATWDATPEIVAAQRSGFERLIASMGD